MDLDGKLGIAVQGRVWSVCIGAVCSYTREDMEDLMDSTTRILLSWKVHHG